MKKLNFDEIYLAFLIKCESESSCYIKHLATKLEWRADDNGGYPSTFCIGDDKPLKAFIDGVNDYIFADSYERKEEAFLNVCDALATPDPDGLTNDLTARNRKQLRNVLSLCAEWV